MKPRASSDPPSLDPERLVRLGVQGLDLLDDQVARLGVEHADGEEPDPSVGDLAYPQREAAAFGDALDRGGGDQHPIGRRELEEGEQVLHLGDTLELDVRGLEELGDELLGAAATGEIDAPDDLPGQGSRNTFTGAQHQDAPAVVPA